MEPPLIFDIHRFALDDGPGIRTTVFMKGCPLRCEWCHNPESWSPKREISFYPSRCISCGDCEAVCPSDAARMDEPGRIGRDACTACGKCAEVCPSTALEVVGRSYAVDELYEILMRDRLYYENSRGGVTFSGGEPMVCMDYLSEIMRRLKREGIHIIIQTCGYFDMADFRKKILPWLDLLFFDIKLIDSETHKKHTGKDNHKILDNFRMLLKEKGLKLKARTPEVPNVITSPENLDNVRALLNEAGCSDHVFLPFNSSLQAKRFSLGHKYFWKPTVGPKQFTAGVIDCNDF